MGHAKQRAAFIIHVCEQEVIAARMKEYKGMELQKLCEEDLSDVAGGTAAGLDQDYFTKGGINIQRTGVIKTPHAPSMSAGSNDLSVEEISSAARTTANTVVMVCPMCGSLAEQWSFSGGRLKCKACGKMH